MVQSTEVMSPAAKQVEEKGGQTPMRKSSCRSISPSTKAGSIFPGSPASTCTSQSPPRRFARGETRSGDTDQKPYLVSLNKSASQASQNTVASTVATRSETGDGNELRCVESPSFKADRGRQLEPIQDATLPKPEKSPERVSRRSLSKDDWRMTQRLERLSQPKREVSVPLEKFEAPPKREKPTRTIRPSLLVRVEPLNIRAAMDQFFENLENGHEISPVFEYARPPESVRKAFNKKCVVDFSLIEEAKQVIDHVMNDLGGPEVYLSGVYSGERIRTKELVSRVQHYLEDLNVDDKVEIRTRPNMLSAANIVNPSQEGKYIVNLTENSVSEQMVESICDHEIGTHLLRMLNDEHQAWHGCRDRYNLGDPWVTEEGFATINTYRSMQTKIMFPQALKYYAICVGAEKGFAELYKEMEPYAPDARKRFRMCCRVKRGLINTAEPGAFNIDQAYFRGAVEILRKIDTLQVARLYSGQVAHEDLDKVYFLLRKEVLRLPKFMNSPQALKTYMKHCRQMLEENFLTVETPRRNMKSVFIRAAKELFTKNSKERSRSRISREPALKRIRSQDHQPVTVSSPSRSTGFRGTMQRSRSSVPTKDNSKDNTGPKTASSFYTTGGLTNAKVNLSNLTIPNLTKSPVAARSSTKEKTTPTNSIAKEPRSGTRESRSSTKEKTARQELKMPICSPMLTALPT